MYYILLFDNLTISINTVCTDCIKDLKRVRSLIIYNFLIVIIFQIDTKISLCDTYTCKHCLTKPSHMKHTCPWNTQVSMYRPHDIIHVCHCTSVFSFHPLFWLENIHKVNIPQGAFKNLKLALHQIPKHTKSH